MEAPCCVLVDVFSASSYYWMIYYTYHSDTDILHYVRVGDFSDPTYYQMAYYTHHRYVEAPYRVRTDGPSMQTAEQTLHDIHCSTM